MTGLLLKLITKGNELLSEHWDQLLSILPLANIIVDFVEEALSADLSAV